MRRLYLFRLVFISIHHEADRCQTNGGIRVKSGRLHRRGLIISLESEYQYKVISTKYPDFINIGLKRTPITVLKFLRDITKIEEATKD
jgi:hypothetical protein